MVDESDAIWLSDMYEMDMFYIPFWKRRAPAECKRLRWHKHAQHLSSVPSASYDCSHFGFVTN